MEYSLKLFLIFLLISLGGSLIEAFLSDIHYKVSKNHYKENHFKLSKYFFFLFFPIVASVIMMFVSGITIFYVFLAFSVIGTICEWIIGFVYHKVIGQRLWTYHKYAINKYTSLLSIPLWGFAGVLLYLLVSIFI